MLAPSDPRRHHVRAHFEALPKTGVGISRISLSLMNLPGLRWTRCETRWLPAAERAGNAAPWWLLFGETRLGWKPAGLRQVLQEKKPNAVDQKASNKWSTLVSSCCGCLLSYRGHVWLSTIH